jgi:hypothetical protein
VLVLNVLVLILCFIGCVRDEHWVVAAEGHALEEEILLEEFGPKLFVGLPARLLGGTWSLVNLDFLLVSRVQVRVLKEQSPTIISR